MIETKLSAPIAEKTPTTFEKNDDVRIDNYHWMRLTDAQKNADIPDEDTQKVVAYLEAENLYMEAELKHTQKFQQEVFEEMKSRIKEDAGGTHHRVTEVTKGTRSAIAINLWDTKPTGKLKSE